jgi:transmembrane sensor
MPAQSGFKVMEQAAEWYAELRCGEVGLAQQEAWHRWIEADPAHREAWEAVQSISLRFDPLRKLPDRRRAADDLLLAHQRVRRRAVLRSLGLLAGIGAFWSTWRLTPLPTWSASLIADYRSGIGELRNVQLPDGSRVWLNTTTAFDMDFSGSSRVVHLLMGEILIDTAHDAERPFIVSTTQGRFRALGTEFSVRLRDQETDLTVFKGAVEVSRPDSSEHRVVPAGQRQTVTVGPLPPTAPADLARQAWSGGMLLAQDIALGQVLDELSRYQFGHISIDPAVAQLNVFGTLPVRDVDAALSILASSLPITVERRMPWWTTISAKNSAP